MTPGRGADVAPLSVEYHRTSPSWKSPGDWPPENTSTSPAGPPEYPIAGLLSHGQPAARNSREVRNDVEDIRRPSQGRFCGAMADAAQ
jgi:hypothetical protein